MKSNKTLLWVAASVAIVAASFFGTLKFLDWFDERYGQRVADLTKLNAALVSYHEANGSYPRSVNDDWTGRRNAFGSSTDNWIPTLVPGYVSSLPRDPRNNDDGKQQYLYKSNGRDFKLISHFPDDCETVKRERPEMIDPARASCGAYGFWSAGAVQW